MTRRAVPGPPFTHVLAQPESDEDVFYAPAADAASTRRAAQEQHARLAHRLTALGARPLSVPFLPGCPESVFVNDVAVLRRAGKTYRALMGRPHHQQRLPEVRPRARVLEAHGFQLHHAQHHLEGGDVLWTGLRTLLGHGFRTDRRAAGELERFTGRPTLGLQLVDPAFYHLDTALAYLTGGELLVAEGALAHPDLVRLHDLPEVTAVVQVPRRFAMRFGLNLLQVGRHVLLAEGCDWVAERLALWGYQPELLQLDEFHLAGGSVACLAAPILDDGYVPPTVEPRPTAGRRITADLNDSFVAA